MKLKDWAEQTGVKYLTAYRWFKAGTLPAPAYQTQSGTIIVEPENNEPSYTSQNDKDNAISQFLKKTVEFSKNNSTVEDFAAYVISNFQLKLNGADKTEDKPFYSRNRPKSEDIQKHFKQFIPAKENQDRLRVVKDLLSVGQAAGDVMPAEMSPLVGDSLGLETPISVGSDPFSTYAYGTFFPTPPPVEGLAITPNVDCSTVTTVETPQSINYTGSTLSQSFNQGGNTFSGDIRSQCVSNSAAVPQSTFFVNSASVIPETINQPPRKRGRKPYKKK